MERERVMTNPKDLVRIELKNAGYDIDAIARYRGCAAAALYIISDVITENGWSLGWDGSKINDSISYA